MTRVARNGNEKRGPLHARCMDLVEIENGVSKKVVRISSNTSTNMEHIARRFSSSCRGNDRGFKLATFRENLSYTSATATVGESSSPDRNVYICTLAIPCDCI